MDKLTEAAIRACMVQKILLAAKDRELEIEREYGKKGWDNYLNEAEYRGHKTFWRMLWKEGYVTLYLIGVLVGFGICLATVQLMHSITVPVLLCG